MPVWQEDFLGFKNLEQIEYIFTNDDANTITATIYDDTDYLNDLTAGYSSTASGENNTTFWRVKSVALKDVKIYEIKIHSNLSSNATLYIYRNNILIKQQSVSAGQIIPLNIFCKKGDTIIFDVIGSGIDYHIEDLQSNENLSNSTYRCYDCSSYTGPEQNFYSTDDTILEYIKSKAFETLDFEAENGEIIAKINSKDDLNLISSHSKLYSLFPYQDLQISFDGSNFQTINNKVTNISFPFWLKAIFSSKTKTKTRMNFFL